MTLIPRTLDDVQRAVRDSASIRVRGGATKAEAGDAETVLDTTDLAGITEYSPEECVFTAQAGTRVRDVTTALARNGQYLPFDPPFASDGATLGGTVATGLSGPRRYRYGGVRDFLIGVRLVDGEGRVIRSGGKVVKNAAGFLLHHGVVGSLGRFGVLTELTFKVFPAPEARRTIVIDCTSVADAIATAREIEAMRYDCEAIDFDERGVVTIGLAGSRAAIDARTERLVRETGRASRLVEAVPDPGTGRGADPGRGTVPVSCVKVAGLMNTWPKLQPYVTQARFMCAGSVAWLETADLAALAHALEQSRLPGLVIRGPRAGQRVGHRPHSQFEARVTRVLDPHGKFSATPDSRG